MVSYASRSRRSDQIRSDNLFNSTQIYRGYKLQIYIKQLLEEVEQNIVICENKDNNIYIGSELG